MKVLQINSVCGFGSTGRIATDLYKVLEEQGHECVIAYGRGEAPKGIKTIKIGSKIDNYIHVVKTRIFDKHGFSSTKATKKFIEKVKEYNPDIIHLHNIHGYYINIEILFNYLKEAKKPVIWTLHDCWAFTGHCCYFDYIGCDKWKKGCNGCVQKREYPSSSLIDNSEFNYLKKKELFTSIKDMKIITPSKWLANLVKQSFLGKYEVEVINNGIDLDIFKPTKGDFRKEYNLEGKFIILGVANIWDKRKGFDIFLELSKKLSKDKVIVLVGLNKKQLKNLPKNIIGITRTNNVKQLAEIYTEADVFLNPTLEDNFPTVNLEALACGTTVVTYNTGGCRETIDNDCGMIIRDNSINSILEIINIKNIGIDTSIYKAKVQTYNKDLRYNNYIEKYGIKSI